MLTALPQCAPVVFGQALATIASTKFSLRLLFVYARNGMFADMELQSLIIGVSVGVAALFFAAAIVLMIGLGA